MSQVQCPVQCRVLDIVNQLQAEIIQIIEMDNQRTHYRHLVETPALVK